jgi:hypothetical protein
VSFTLSSAYTGTTWKVYTASTGTTEAPGVSAANSGTALTLTHITDIPAADYYVAATETGKTESARLKLTVTAYVSGDYTIADATNPDLLAKFGVSTASHAFTALHNLISAPATGDDFTTIIALGDYVDLPSLTIDGTTITDTAIAANSSRLLRLIVVGINSFNSQGSYDLSAAPVSDAAAKGYNDATAHVVFQFQNVPVTHQMEATDTDGYAGGSAMRTWLTASFLPGLQAATGLTNTELWAPTRYVANNGYATAADEITDTLWLPTEWEMDGSNDNSSLTYETAANQARLEYYPAGTSGDTSRIKYDNNNNATWYWLASPWRGDVGMFVYVYTAGDAYGNNASVVGGCAPAFCVR